MQAKMNTGLTLGLPTLGRPISLDWAFNFKSLTPPINYNMILQVVYGKPVADARNEIAEQALSNGSRYLFFLGDDVIVPMHTLRQLIFRMENMQNLGIVGGVYCSKSDPSAPLVFRGNGKGSYWNWKVGEFFEVTGLGMDCTLIHTDVFKSLEKPWFKTIQTDDYEDAVNHTDMWTEDLYFCDRVEKETNYKIYCDGSIICEHVDIYSKRTFTLPANSYPVKGHHVEDKPKLLDIGSGGIKQPNFDAVDPKLNECQRITVDIREDTNPDFRCDARKLPFETGTMDYVFSSHCLEHFGRAEWLLVLNEWIRVLKPGGTIYIVVPDIEWAFKNWDKHRNDAMNVLYGGQSNEFDFHQTGFTKETLKMVLVDSGFLEKVGVKQGSTYNIIGEASKRENNLQEKVVAIKKNGLKPKRRRHTASKRRSS